MNIIWGSTGRNSFGNNSVGSGWCWFAPLPALVSFSPVQILHPWVQGLNVVPGSLKPPWRLTYDTLYLFIHLFIPSIAFNKEYGQDFSRTLLNPPITSFILCWAQLPLHSFVFPGLTHVKIWHQTLTSQEEMRPMTSIPSRDESWDSFSWQGDLNELQGFTIFHSKKSVPSV